MKKITLFLLLSVVIILSAEAHKYKSGYSRKYVAISMQTFYDELSPYGDWIYTSDHGFVWRPYFKYSEDFRPYSNNGHWVNTDFGWTWVSDYRWGWAAFHYGRWTFDDYLGWMWVPGYEWAPAWVTWGNYGDYYGWAPMGPDVFVYNTSTWFAPDPWWTFVPRRHFCSDNWNEFIYHSPVHVANITYISNVYSNNNNTRNSWYYGPRVSDVEKYSAGKIRRMEVVDSKRADNTGIRNNRLNVYRPQVENKRTDIRPAEFRSAEQVRTERRDLQNRSVKPVVNNTSKTRVDIRNSSPAPATRINTSDQEKRNEARSSSRPAPIRKSSDQNIPKPVTREATQSNAQTLPVSRQTRVEARTATRQEANNQNTRLIQEPKERKTNPDVRSMPETNVRNTTSKAEVKQVEKRNSGLQSERNQSAKSSRR